MPSFGESQRGAMTQDGSSCSAAEAVRFCISQLRDRWQTMAGVFQVGAAFKFFAILPITPSQDCAGRQGQRA
jgi:hypothetical protein